MRSIYQAKGKRWRLMTAAIVCFGLGTMQEVSGQTGSEIPLDRDAEVTFGRGIDAFRSGDFSGAAQLFQAAYDTLPLHRRTTASMVMEAKALFRQGAYAETIEHVDEFLRRFPSSSYVADCERLRDLAAREARNGLPETITIGILLPMSDEDARLSQALFNGLRLAVDEHNANLNGSPPVRMVFRDSRGGEEKVAAAVGELFNVGAVAIVGPLYSEEATHAAREAERRQTVLVAPLATEESVARGKRFVFQANATISMRGRQMARFAVRNLRLRQLAIIAEMNDSLSERMTEGFLAEAAAVGGEVVFVKYVNGTKGWFGLRNSVTADTLSGIDALYLPIAGGNAQVKIGAALDGLDRLRTNIRILGSGEWHDIPARGQASAYATTYTNDFYVDRSDNHVATFVDRYTELSQSQPNRLSYTGYDVTRFVIEKIVTHPDLPLHHRFYSDEIYQGLGIRIRFSGSNVNEALYYQRYRDGEIVLLR